MAMLNKRHPNNNADAAGDIDNHNDNVVVLIDQQDDDDNNNDKNKALRSSSSSYNKRLMKIGFISCCCFILILLTTMNSNKGDERIIIVQSSSTHGLRKYPSPTQNKNNLYNYEPSILESYIVNNGRSNINMEYDRQIKLNDYYNSIDYNKLSSNLPSGCELWTNPQITTPKIYKALQKYRKQLQDYTIDTKQFQRKFTTNNNGDQGNNGVGSGDGEGRGYYDLRDYFTEDDYPHNPNNNSLNYNDATCDSIYDIHPLSQIFRNPSFLSKSSDGIYMEPFLPPLRSPELCYNEQKHGQEHDESTALDYHHLLDMDYLIHDFVNICKKRIHKYSRTIFIDMGASLQYHIDDHSSKELELPPTLQLLNLYSKFGIQFDHIYGYEYTIMDPNLVYNVHIPNKYKAAYHWYNIGVSSNITSYTNPLRLILDTYNKETDFIVIKLDIDTPTIEIQLSKLLLEIPELTKLVDIFYFEHHIAMKELSAAWKSTMINSGSIQDSMEFFTSLREHNILAHYWI
ncbi:hypothetical protein FRACYDRAFT_251850 [Fragilariopsis cylindrus CCMP1102]|uniref:Uncharacterized protein n=1 Tax=Fragilariopsis cylindrus CCMP1102 TaxID=635003 RepID=A0A1E7EMI3_9STRA|nr:hypothetical protein FRACYDRAFT_251850 [Fragilariopsis cylindrus CCMP1102]|eukprot:OEU07111.1 hypothetical protein FRACYDRAFT_251850 [Fragilariopsis cylindrus CCMP1102]